MAYSLLSFLLLAQGAAALPCSLSMLLPIPGTPATELPPGYYEADFVSSCTPTWDQAEGGTGTVTGLVSATPPVRPTQDGSSSYTIITSVNGGLETTITIPQTGSPQETSVPGEGPGFSSVAPTDPLPTQTGHDVAGGSGGTQTTTRGANTAAHETNTGSPGGTHSHHSDPSGTETSIQTGGLGGDQTVSSTPIKTGSNTVTGTESPDNQTSSNPTETATGTETGVPGGSETPPSIPTGTTANTHIGHVGGGQTTSTPAETETTTRTRGPGGSETGTSTPTATETNTGTHLGAQTGTQTVTHAGTYTKTQTGSHTETSTGPGHSGGSQTTSNTSGTETETGPTGLGGEQTTSLTYTRSTTSKGTGDPGANQNPTSTKSTTRTHTGGAQTHPTGTASGSSPVASGSGSPAAQSPSARPGGSGTPPVKPPGQQTTSTTLTDTDTASPGATLPPTTGPSLTSFPETTTDTIILGTLPTNTATDTLPPLPVILTPPPDFTTQIFPSLKGVNTLVTTTDAHHSKIVIPVVDGKGFVNIRKPGIYRNLPGMEKSKLHVPCLFLCPKPPSISGGRSGGAGGDPPNPGPPPGPGPTGGGSGGGNDDDDPDPDDDEENPDPDEDEEDPEPDDDENPPPNPGGTPPNPNNPDDPDQSTTPSTTSTTTTTTEECTSTTVKPVTTKVIECTETVFEINGSTTTEEECETETRSETITGCDVTATDKTTTTTVSTTTHAVNFAIDQFILGDVLKTELPTPLITAVILPTIGPELPKEVFTGVIAPEPEEEEKPINATVTEVVAPEPEGKLPMDVFTGITAPKPEVNPPTDKITVVIVSEIIEIPSDRFIGVTMTPTVTKWNGEVQACTEGPGITTDPKNGTCVGAYSVISTNTHVRNSHHSELTKTLSDFVNSVADAMIPTVTNFNGEVMACTGGGGYETHGWTTTCKSDYSLISTNTTVRDMASTATQAIDAIASILAAIPSASPSAKCFNLGDYTDEVWVDSGTHFALTGINGWTNEDDFGETVHSKCGGGSKYRTTTYEPRYKANYEGKERDTEAIWFDVAFFSPQCVERAISDAGGPDDIDCTKVFDEVPREFHDGPKWTAKCYNDKNDGISGERSYFRITNINGWVDEDTLLDEIKGRCPIITHWNWTDEGDTNTAWFASEGKKDGCVEDTIRYLSENFIIPDGCTNHTDEDNPEDGMYETNEEMDYDIPFSNIGLKL